MIKILLLAVIVLLFLYFIKNRNTMKLRASKKVLFIVFIVGGVISIANPNLLSRVARSIGVGRGTDLLLYGLVLSFSFVTLNVYLKFKDYDEKISQLTREVALKGARKPTAGHRN
jgi:hypothetical protein